MILKISWEEFRPKYFHNSPVFAYEHDDRWCFYTHDGPLILKCEKEKFEDAQDQALFKAGVFHARNNVTMILEDPEYIEIPEAQDEYEYPQMGDGDSLY